MDPEGGADYGSGAGAYGEQAQQDAAGMAAYDPAAAASWGAEAGTGGAYDSSTYEAGAGAYAAGGYEGGSYEAAGYGATEGYGTYGAYDSAAAAADPGSGESGWGAEAATAAAGEAAATGEYAAAAPSYSPAEYLRYLEGEIQVGAVSSIVLSTLCSTHAGACALQAASTLHSFCACNNARAGYLPMLPSVPRCTLSPLALPAHAPPCPALKPTANFPPLQHLSSSKAGLQQQMAAAATAAYREMSGRLGEAGTGVPVPADIPSLVEELAALQAVRQYLQYLQVGRQGRAALWLGVAVWYLRSERVGWHCDRGRHGREWGRAVCRTSRQWPGATMPQQHAAFYAGAWPEQHADCYVGACMQ